jgi:SAM-dependent methyltransferase
MSQVFGSAYSDSYDAIYQDKDYQAECALVSRLLRDFGDQPVRRVLDLGCGTGNHVIPLTRLGYEVVGVERSEEMLARARAKASKAFPNQAIAFHQGDIRTKELASTFDAALMMFAVLGYQQSNADVLAALRTAHRHLRPGGLFIYDVWYGPAVLHERPSQRVKVIPTADGKILRVASGAIDSWRQLCKVDYLLWNMIPGRPVVETEESHTMRYFFPQELDLFLEVAQFKPLRLGAFPGFDRDPDETTWNVMGVARAT